MREALSFAELSGFDFGREPVFEMSQLLLSLRISTIISSSDRGLMAKV